MDFEQVPLWQGSADNFEILANDINGRIPVTRLEMLASLYQSCWNRTFSTEQMPSWCFAGIAATTGG